MIDPYGIIQRPLVTEKSLAQMLGLPWATWERLLIWLGLGLVIYFAYGQRSAARHRARLAGTG